MDRCSTYVLLPGLAGQCRYECRFPAPFLEAILEALRDHDRQAAGPRVTGYPSRSASSYDFTLAASSTRGLGSVPLSVEI